MHTLKNYKNAIITRDNVELAYLHLLVNIVLAICHRNIY